MAEKKTAQTPRYDRAELLENAESLFSVKPEVLAGALHGEEQNELTVDEVRRRIHQFLKRKVN
jgi:hypothetical protein